MSDSSERVSHNWCFKKYKFFSLIFSMGFSTRNIKEEWSRRFGWNANDDFRKSKFNSFDGKADLKKTWDETAEELEINLILFSVKNTKLKMI